MRIAICDDERNDANKIRFALLDVENRLEIDIFESGQDFLDSIKVGRQYDLVFMDIYMGDENGMEIVRAMQAISPDTQVIFSTISVDHAVEAFEVNAIGYLVKPYSEADIVVETRDEKVENTVKRVASAVHHFFQQKNKFKGKINAQQ